MPRLKRREFQALMSAPFIAGEPIISLAARSYQGIHRHLSEMPVLAFLINGDLRRIFTVAKVTEKRSWQEPMVNGGLTPALGLNLGAVDSIS